MGGEKARRIGGNGRQKRRGRDGGDKKAVGRDRGRGGKDNEEMKRKKLKETNRMKTLKERGEVTGRKKNG